MMPLDSHQDLPVALARARNMLRARIAIDCAYRLIIPRIVREAETPRTLDQIRAAVRTAEGRLFVDVSGAYSGRTIWGAPAHNVRFRAHHDVAHLDAAAPLTTEGERLACGEQAASLYRAALAFDAPPLSDGERRLLAFEVIGQRLAYDAWGAFPRDQVAFTVAAWRKGIRAAIDSGAGR